MKKSAGRHEHHARVRRALTIRFIFSPVHNIPRARILARTFPTDLTVRSYFQMADFFSTIVLTLVFVEEVSTSSPGQCVRCL